MIKWIIKFILIFTNYLDPLFWDWDDVCKWLLWSQNVFVLRLDSLKVEDFPKSGYELCKLQKHDLINLIGDKKEANILYQHLKHLKKGMKKDLLWEWKSIYSYIKFRAISWTTSSKAMTNRLKAILVSIESIFVSDILHLFSKFCFNVQTISNLNSDSFLLKALN